MITKTKYGMCHEENLEETKCGVCSQAKHTKAFTNGKLAEHADGITVHTDICGPMQTQTLRGRIYFLVMAMSPPDIPGYSYC